MIEAGGDDRPRLLLLMGHQYDTAPAQRFRWEQWLPYLDEAGFSVEVVCFGTEQLSTVRRSASRPALLKAFSARYAAWWREVSRKCKAADAVVVLRGAALAGPPLAETMLWLRRKPIIYDLDDAIFLTPDFGGTPAARLWRCEWACAHIARLATHVGAGNEYLRSYVARFNRATSIWPTTISMERYPAKPRKVETALPVVGWTGSESTSHYLKSLLPELRELQRERQFELLVMGAAIDLAAHGIRGRCVPWSPQSEVPIIGEMDIGLMPLIDTPWARGKCALKALQYQAVGTPAVVSDVGMNREAVKHGSTGFVVEPQAPWTPFLKQLLDDVELRSCMGNRARQHVFEKFSAERVAPRIAAEIKDILKRPCTDNLATT